MVQQEQKIAVLGLATSWAQQPAEGGATRVIHPDYPVRSQPRYGHGRALHPQLHQIIARNRPGYRQVLTDFLRYQGFLVQIARQTRGPTSEPAWANSFLAGPDAVALYGFVSLRNPQRYFEVGSGNSTKFVRRAIRDQNLRTRITSIGPCPRAEIDALCDLAIRRPVEDVDVEMFDELESGDILFVDHSHRVLMN